MEQHVSTTGNLSFKLPIMGSMPLMPRTFPGLDRQDDESVERLVAPETRYEIGDGEAGGVHNTGELSSKSAVYSCCRAQKTTRKGKMW